MSNKAATPARPSSSSHPSRNAMPMIIAVVVAVTILGGLAVAMLGGDDGAPTEVSADGAGIPAANEAPVGDSIPTADEVLAPEGGAESGEKAPEVTFNYFDGGEGSFADFEGRPTVVNFFASWCAPCIQEMPDFEEVFQDYGDQVNFIGLNTQDRIEDGRRIAANTGVTYTLAGDADGSIFAAFGGFGMPTTVFLAADGTIISTQTGLMTGGALREVIEQDMLS